MGSALTETSTQNQSFLDTLARALFVSSVRQLNTLIEKHGYDKEMARRIIASQILRIEAWVIVSEILFIAQQHAERASLYIQDIYPPVMVAAIFALCVSIADLANTILNDHDEQAKVGVNT